MNGVVPFGVVGIFLFSFFFCRSEWKFIKIGLLAAGYMFIYITVGLLTKSGDGIHDSSLNYVIKLLCA